MDEATLPWFGEIYYSLCEYKGEHVSQDILLPWMKNAKRVMERLASYGEIEARLWHPETEEVRSDLERWYALSRVNDLLLLQFQPGRGEEEDGAFLHHHRDIASLRLPSRLPKIGINDYLHFFVEMGMHPFDYPTFHPFYHEIVEVEQTKDPNAPSSF